MLAKKMLTDELVASQTAIELPQRRMLSLVTVVITNVLNNLSINVNVKNNNIAVQVCAVVQAINTILAPGSSLTCTIGQ